MKDLLQHYNFHIRYECGLFFLSFFFFFSKIKISFNSNGQRASMLGRGQSGTPVRRLTGRALQTGCG